MSDIHEVRLYTCPHVMNTTADYLLMIPSAEGVMFHVYSCASCHLIVGTEFKRFADENGYSSAGIETVPLKKTTT